MKNTKKQDQKRNLNIIKVKELTLEDLAPIAGGAFEDAKNKGGES